MKLENIIKHEKGIYAIINDELPVFLSFRLKDIAAIMKDYETAKNILLEKYAETNDGGISYKVKPKYKEVFQEEYNALLQEDLNLDIKPININDLQGARISARDIEGLIDLGILESH